MEGLNRDIRLSPGRPIPYGVTLGPKGTQFSVFSRNATAVSLLLFRGPEPGTEGVRIDALLHVLQNFFPGNHSYSEAFRSARDGRENVWPPISTDVEKVWKLGPSAQGLVVWAYD